MGAARLGARLPEALRRSLAHRVRAMNSYYSHLIEGRATHPLDIDRALTNDYSAEPKKAELQYEARAHIGVQVEVERRLGQESDLAICSTAFVRWLHRAFYEQMPEQFRFVIHRGERVPIVPGEWRTRDVAVGRHVPPEHGAVPRFMQRFEEVYDPPRIPVHQRVVAACAAHHRLAWIHPFIDGNGRVARILTDAYLVRIGFAVPPLWTVSRGLANRRDRYMEALTWADAPRRGDLDGRGPLSLEGLQRFCLLMLDVAIDQVAFMAGLFDLDRLEERIAAYVHLRATERELRPEARHLLTEVLHRGPIARGDAVRVSGLGERVGRDLLSKLLRMGLLETDGPKRPVRLGLPARVLPYYLPNLYPTPIEEDFRNLPPPEPPKNGD
ncbi:MAG: Fic family protein [Myxococcales bacterium]|nr:Fic family protein [Myxococcales bacterium]